MMRVNDVVSLNRIKRMTKFGWKFYIKTDSVNKFMLLFNGYKGYRVLDVDSRKRKVWIAPNVQ